jgi:peptidyl-prolyl cis-trans isomerase A (cyclophilin A)
MAIRWMAWGATALAIAAGCGGGGGNTGGSTPGTSTTDTGSGGATTTTTDTGSVTSTGGTGTTSSTGTGGAVACGPDPSAPNEILPDTTDPAKGVFTMEDALAGLPDGPGPLRAIIDTDLGTITCALRPDKAPNGVANFVGLARGVRPWKDPKTKEWVKRRYYDGLTFHRVIPMFMAQGGDPLGTGTGGPGYKFADEISDLVHEPGTLSYANAGPNTNGSQFYITEVKTDWLDGGYTIIGACEPVDVVVALTGVPTNSNDKPLTPLHMKTVEITRCAP